MDEDVERAELEQVTGEPILPVAGWRTVLFDNDELHVHPIDDIVDHDLTGDGCVCGVAAEVISHDDDADTWMFVHHSLDGREASE